MLPQRRGKRCLHLHEKYRLRHGNPSVQELHEAPLMVRHTVFQLKYPAFIIDHGIAGEAQLMDSGKISLLVAQNFIYMYSDDTVVRFLIAEAHRREVTEGRDHTEGLDRNIEFLLHMNHLPRENRTNVRLVKRIIAVLEEENNRAF